jgi:hypothetical protein
MATTDGDVIMTDASTNGDAAASSSTNSPPAIAISAPATSQSSSRTDHDRQLEYKFLPTSPLKRQKIHVSQNLISDYGLDEVHSRVRRNDPVTGEKINKLRKSYVGIVKTLHIAGSSKEVLSPNAWIDVEHMHDPKGLMDKQRVETGVEVIEGMQVPQFAEVWKVDVAPVERSRKQGLLAKLGAAVQMAPGKLQDSEKWRKMLGDDSVVKKPAVPLVSALKAPGVTQSAKPSPRMGPSLGRTQRTGAKRSYDDASFSGYNETYDEPERPMSQADVMRKKQRKVPKPQNLVR